MNPPESAAGLGGNPTMVTADSQLAFMLLDYRTSVG